LLLMSCAAIARGAVRFIWQFSTGMVESYSNEVWAFVRRECVWHFRKKQKQQTKTKGTNEYTSSEINPLRSHGGLRHSGSIRQHRDRSRLLLAMLCQRWVGQHFVSQRRHLRGKFRCHLEQRWRCGGRQRLESRFIAFHRLQHRLPERFLQ